MATIIFNAGFVNNASPQVVLTSTELTEATAPTIDISSTLIADGTTIASVVSGGAMVYDQYTATWSYRLAGADLATKVYKAKVTTTYATASPASVQVLGIVIPDELVGSRAAPGALMGLVDDAITAGKFDESTAFPLKAVDTGATQVARVGADSDTLETLSDQIDGVSAGAGLTAQETRDALKLAPSAGAAAAGSVDAHLDAIQAKTDTIGALSVTITAPVATVGTGITLIHGDDYLNVDTRALYFVGTNWPVITGGTVALRLAVGGVAMAYVGVITGAAACYVELTDTLTTAIPPGTYNYDLEFVLSNASVVTLVQGTFTMLADVR